MFSYVFVDSDSYILKILFCRLWLSTKLLDFVEGLFNSWSLSKVQISQLWKEKVNYIDNNKLFVFSMGKIKLS